jgi:very-short-patch-repair endonuclease
MTAMNRNAFKQSIIEKARELNFSNIDGETPAWYGHMQYVISEYESPIEERFAWLFTKYVSPSVLFVPQVWIKTKKLSFRFDFVALIGEKIIVFECDGKAHHSMYLDEFRDALILDTGCVDYIHRLRGEDIHYQLEDLVYAIYRMHPYLFHDRLRKNLELLANPSIISFDNYDASAGSIIIPYVYPYKVDSENPSLQQWNRENFVGGEPRFLCIRNFCVSNYSKSPRQWWQRLVMYANLVEYSDIEDLGRLYQDDNNKPEESKSDAWKTISQNW